MIPVRRPTREIARVVPMNGTSAPLPPPPVAEFLLLETADFLLLEDGSKLVLE